MPSVNVPLLVKRNSFGNGQGGVYDSRRATARGDRASIPCAASPPSTFCQDQVTTSSFAQGNGMAKAAEVASQIASPCRPAAIQSASLIRTPEVVPFHGNTTSCAGSTAARSGSSP